MPEDERHRLNNQPLRNSMDSSSNKTVESLAAALEKKALGRLGTPSNGSTTGDVKVQDQTSVMKAQLDEKMKVLERRTNEEIKRIVRREFMKDAVTSLE